MSTTPSDARAQSAGPEISEDDNPFLSNPRLRFMKRLVIALGVVLILGFVTLVAAIIYRVTKLAKPPAGLQPGVSGEPLSSDQAAKLLGSDKRAVIMQALPPGSVIASSLFADGQVALTFRDAGGHSLVIVDATSGQVRAITRFQNEGPKRGQGATR